MRRSYSAGRHGGSPSGKKSAGARPGRALRWARLSYYALFAPTFLYSLWVQLVVLKGPGRVPIPASRGFGRDSVFLTFHVERATHKWTAVLFPLASFVGVAYYLILHFHPLTRLRASLVPDYDEKMALLHAVPLVFALGDSLLKDEELMRRHGLERRSAVRGICGYGAIYFAWSCLCVYINGGNWPYPFQKKFSPIQHMLFLASVLLVATYLTRFGFRIQARLDKRRRRRLARLAVAAAEAARAR